MKKSIIGLFLVMVISAVTSFAGFLPEVPEVEPQWGWESEAHLSAGQPLDLSIVPVSMTHVIVKSDGAEFLANGVKTLEFSWCIAGSRVDIVAIDPVVLVIKGMQLAP